MRLLCGALDGAICVLNEGRGVSYLCETLETALAIIATGTSARVAHVLKRENIGRIDLPPGQETWFIFEAARGTDARLLSQLQILHDKGVPVVVLSSDQVEVQIAIEGMSL